MFTAHHRRTGHAILVDYRRQGGQGSQKYEQGALALHDILMRSHGGVSVKLIANRLEQGENIRSLMYGVTITENYFPKLPHLNIGMGGGQYGDFLAYSLQADYLWYLVGFSQLYYLFNYTIGLMPSIKATYWDHRRQNANPGTPQEDLWGWVGSLTVRYKDWNFWFEYRQRDDLQLTSIGTSYSFKIGN